MFFDQRPFDIRCEWGNIGLQQLLAQSDAIVIVDVLSFSTCVDIAVSNGAIVYPYPWKDDTAVVYAKARTAILAEARRQPSGGYSLSPASLLQVPPGTRLLLPSPNGATLSLATGAVPTFAACLRNASAVAQALSTIGRRISVVPAGERWPDGSLRPALEDLLGAGAIIQHLLGTRSPEATMAEAAFQRLRAELGACLQQCGSGRELIGRGFASDVELAAALDQSDRVPVLTDGAYGRFLA